MPKSPKPPFVREDGARSGRMEAMMDESRHDQKCPLCKLLSGERSDQEIIYRSCDWAVIENISPEPGAKLQLLIFSDGHPSSNMFDDLPILQRMQLMYVIEELRRHPLVLERMDGLDFAEWGYYLDTRPGPNGEHNAATVMHPCWNLIVSDGLPVDLSQVDRIALEIVEEFSVSLVLALFDHNREHDPARVQQLEALAPAKLLSEALRFGVTNINLYRSWLESKARPIWRKASNRADQPASS